jgi:predicted ABC-class ATPase
LSAQCGVSSILVVGGVGDYLDVADTVLLMEAFRPQDVTQRARAIAAAWPATARRQTEGTAHWPAGQPRPVQRDGLSPRRGQRDRVRAHGVRAIQYGTEEIDMTQVEQLVDAGQTRYIADCLQYVYHRLADGRRTVAELVKAVDALVQQHGLDVLQSFQTGDRSWARPYEVAAALNRLRTLRILES